MNWNKYVTTDRPRNAGAMRNIGLTQSARIPVTIIVNTVDGMETSEYRL